MVELPSKHLSFDGVLRELAEIEQQDALLDRDLDILLAQRDELEAELQRMDCEYEIWHRLAHKMNHSILCDVLT